MLGWEGPALRARLPDRKSHKRQAASVDLGVLGGRQSKPNQPQEAYDLFLANRKKGREMPPHLD